MLRIRPAAVSDLVPLRALVESAYRGDSARAGWTHEADLLDGQRTDLAALTDILADGSRTLLLAEEDGVLVGSVLVALEERAGESYGYLGMLTVRPDRQGSGLGRAIVQHAEHHALHTLGAARMEMTVIKARRELIAWYERLGYADTGRESPFPVDDPRFGIPKVAGLVFVVLEKSLAPRR